MLLLLYSAPALQATNELNRTKVLEENNIERWKSHHTAAVTGATFERSSVTDAVVKFELLGWAEDELEASEVADCRLESTLYNTFCHESKRKLVSVIKNLK